MPDATVEPLSPARFPRTHALIARALADGTAPALAAGLWEIARPDRILVHAAGWRRRQPTPLAGVTAHTPFDLSSLSKILGTATLAGRLVDRGWLRWDTPLEAILPTGRHAGIEIRHLLSHTAGLTWWEPFHEALRATFGGTAALAAAGTAARQREMRRLVLAARPTARPGERVVYSDLSFLLLGFALEGLIGRPLDEAIRSHVWTPAGLPGLHYRRANGVPAEVRDDRYAATENCPWRGGILQGQVHDDNCWAMGGYGGHAGAFGSVVDVLAFARAISEGRILSRATLREQWTRVGSPRECDRNAGWDTPSGDAPSVGGRFSSRTVGHLGFTGTSLWIDLEAGIAVALLTNRVHPTRENTQIRQLRPLFHDAIREDLGR